MKDIHSTFVSEKDTLSFSEFICSSLAVVSVIIQATPFNGYMLEYCLLPVFWTNYTFCHL